MCEREWAMMMNDEVDLEKDILPMGPPGRWNDGKRDVVEADGNPSPWQTLNAAATSGSRLYTESLVSPQVDPSRVCINAPQFTHGAEEALFN